MLDEFKQECTPFGQTVFKGSSIKAQFFDGCRNICLKYEGHEADSNILKHNFSNQIYPLTITLNYLICDNNDIITRWTTVKNNGNDSICFDKLFSAQFNL